MEWVRQLQLREKAASTYHYRSATKRDTEVEIAVVDVAPSSEGDGPAEVGVVTDAVEQGTVAHAIAEWELRRTLR